MSHKPKNNVYVWVEYLLNGIRFKMRRAYQTQSTNHKTRDTRWETERFPFTKTKALINDLNCLTKAIPEVLPFTSSTPKQRIYAYDFCYAFVNEMNAWPNQILIKSTSTRNTEFNIYRRIEFCRKNVISFNSRRKCECALMFVQNFCWINLYICDVNLSCVFFFSVQPFFVPAHQIYILYTAYSKVSFAILSRTIDSHNIANEKQIHRLYTDGERERNKYRFDYFDICQMSLGVSIFELVDSIVLALSLSLFIYWQY